MPTAQEKAEFSTRLKQALKNTSPTTGAADLARLFNAQTPSFSGIGISVQTAHKWLTGKAIPASEKISILAERLGVSKDWLRHEAQPESAQSTINNPALLQVTKLIEKIQALPEHQQYLIEKYIERLLKDQPH